jgi:hypothetical protein
MRVADLLVGNGIRCASTFERYRVGDMHSLHRGPFSFPQNHDNLATGDVRLCLHFSAGASFCQATPDSLCSVRPPTS